MNTHTTRLAVACALILVFATGIGVLARQAQGATATPAPTNASGQATVPASSGNSDTGQRIFVKYGCAACHGREGQGAPLSGPRIAPAPLPLAAFLKYVRTPTGQMPPYTAKVVTDRELEDIRAFLASRPRPSAAAQAALPPD